MQAFSEAFAQSQDQAQQNNHAQQIHAVQQGHQQALTSVGAELFPTSSDPTADLSGEMASVAKELGFKSQEIESTTDPRVMMLAHYASIGIQYNKDKHNRQKVQKKVKPQRVKSKQPVVSTITQSQAARKRLKGSGSIDDAIQALS